MTYPEETNAPMALRGRRSHIVEVGEAAVSEIKKGLVNIEVGCEAVGVGDHVGVRLVVPVEVLVIMLLWYCYSRLCPTSKDTKTKPFYLRRVKQNIFLLEVYAFVYIQKFRAFVNSFTHIFVIMSSVKDECISLVLSNDCLYPSNPSHPSIHHISEPPCLSTTINLSHPSITILTHFFLNQGGK